jgi:lantibiotic biosynthesis protein
MNSVLGAWSPIVEGEAATRALAAAAAIASDLERDPAIAASAMGLSGGHSGLALFLAYLEQSLGDAKAGEHAERHLERAVDYLAEEHAADASLYHGFTGVAWVTEHLAAKDSAGMEDPNAEIDAALLSILCRSPWRGDFDLLGGLVGWGVYALERLPRASAEEILALIVVRLTQCSERQSRGIAWRDPRHANHGPDWGMAHGSAGVIALLARMVQESAAGPNVASLLTAAVDGVLGRPSTEGNDDESDLAWCAGDAGLSVALLAAGRACGRDDWERAAGRLAAIAAERYPQDVHGFDPALCHGTSGLSLLFHRLYQATGDPALLAAALKWLERTLTRRKTGEGIGGYRCRARQPDGRFGWMANPGFLSGAAGIGLALLAAATPVEPAWDRLLLLSGRTGQYL